MSLFEKIGLSGGDSSDEGDAAADGESGSVADSGPNFMPERQRELYVTAYENKVHLTDRGTCGACGTTLKPVEAGRLLASCKNEDCENHLREIELTAARRFHEREGHPDDLEIDAKMAATTDGGDGKRNALDGLKDAMGDEE